MTANPYPNLGFDPAPGDAEQVSALGMKVKAAAEAVTETNSLLTRLRNSNDDVWKGDAGQAFRDNFDATLAQDLDRAQAALQGARDVITVWHADLVGFQEAARTLELEAAAARADHTRAVTGLQQAKADPDLNLAHQTFTDAAQLASAQARLDAAGAKLASAATTVNQCQTTIDAIIARATSLQTNHSAKARVVATELDAAANFAPSEPDKSFWEWITDAFVRNQDTIHDILATTSAVTGLLALVTPPPFSIGLGVLAFATGLGALGMNALNPEVQDALTDIGNDFDDGNINTEGLTTLTKTVGVDSLAVLPGVGGLFKASKVGFFGADTAITAADGAADVATASKFKQVMTAFGDGAQSPGLVTKGLDIVGSTIPAGSLGTHTATALQGLSQMTTHQASVGTTAGGIELLGRSVKAGIGLDSASEMIGTWWSND